MQALISGASGLVGGSLVKALRASGDVAVRLVRRREAAAAPGAAWWNPAAGELDASALTTADAVIHLAGENVAGGRWSESRKARIRSSRVAGTRLIAEALASEAARRRAEHPGAELPMLLCASAIGYYGDRGEALVNEASSPGEGFLAEVCQAWEEAAAPAREAGLRVVHLRIGVVLSPEGGALAKMLPPFRLGLGGPLGSGRQFMSWITVADLVGVIRHALAEDTLVGPLNAVAPQPVTQGEMARVLGQVLGRPAIVPTPAFALRLALGEMADEMLLASTRVDAGRLLASGYTFEHPELLGALNHLLADDSSASS